MWTLIKLFRSYVKNVEEYTSNKPLQSERSQVSSLAKPKLHTYQSPSSAAKPVDTSTPNSSPKKAKRWSNYSGIQEDIYD
jgi:transglutaminase/protease-like cytokinesis protein 3